jgi:arginyl-tRNA synthetase
MAKRKAKIDEKSCELIGLAAIKYFLLKTSSYKNIVFNPEESLSFEGNTGTYLLYSLVRAYKIIKGAEKTPAQFSPKLIDSKEEFDLIKDIDYIKEAVKLSAQKNSIHLLASHAYKTAGDFNAFYEKCQVLSISEKELKNSRIALVKSFIIAMERMLYLLGIEPVKEM